MNSIFWTLAVRGLLRNKKRTLLTAIAFTIGFSSLFLLAAYINRVERVLRAQTIYVNMNGHIRVQKSGSERYWNSPRKYLLSSENIDSLKKELTPYSEQIEYINERLRASAQITVGDKTFPIFIDAFDPTVEKRAKENWQVKEWFLGFFNYSADDFSVFENDNLGVSLTPDLARMLGLNAHSFKDKVHTEAQIFALDMEASLNAIDVGVNRLHLSASPFLSDFSVEMDIKQARDLMRTDGASELNIFLKSNFASSKYISIIESQLRSLGDYEVYRYNTEQVSPTYIGNLGILSVIMIFFMAIIGASVALAVINVLTISILERSQEIGTYLSLGFSSTNIRSLFLAEAAIIAGSGFALGTILSLTVSRIVNQLRIPFRPPGSMGEANVQIDLNWQIGLLIALIMSVVLFISSYLVIKKQTQKKVVQLLADSEGK
jgi:putative ABC transport system permease protein